MQTCCKSRHNKAVREDKEVPNTAVRSVGNFGKMKKRVGPSKFATLM
jgi:hypothetical protein